MTCCFGESEIVIGVTVMISNKKALEAAKVIVDFCNEQRGCQNCIFHIFGCDHWKCQMYAFELQDVLRNIEAKKKNHGYL